MGLTRAYGPLAPGDHLTNYALDGPAHKLYQHPFPRRVRAEVAGRTILDTTAGVLVHETALLPRLYVPESDLDASAFVPSDTTTHCPFKGDATYRTLRVGDREFPDALWAYPSPIPSAPWLAGYASLYWEAADAWYDEDEQVYAHLTDPFTRVDVRPTSRHVEVFAGETLVASSDSPLRLDETGLPTRWYLSPSSVVADLVPSETHMRCPYKGESSYWNVALADGRVLSDAAWGYSSPLPESSPIAGYYSFLHDELRTVVDGVEI
jgi:uncharacterized protein (DUF427 family)